ncbi:hypothetical protein [Deinococcus soli (ex Cha et al. 2016)]|uniref:Uncharacterized protein n=2 Tax=Deinococcus soli (ex Cha et al. 2016) TaxID=1309411 RepID=A0ACC6KGJ2_9DEIO|nr:hypothetical protein [Deinococcus soli (ex Cha et al. 2016)]MDR6219043.1 hypothetical protein [Deinococcus soli (ex Cha et al. 2016)]MDR6328840.1 hypothetical protein [Deinococcus soli (ex Cha et al. 2016)]MDR6751672.1 hypothetical protein [Deinococcus soli (ex Cha et al. 2016)]
MPVTRDMREWAAGVRAERDQEFGNYYAVGDADMREAGELGELAFDLWLREAGCAAHHWETERVRGAEDFRLGTQRIDIKTVKRAVPMRDTYTAQITAKQGTEGLTHLVFATYEVPSSTLLLLGIISVEEFRQSARYYGPGEQVHAKYTVRDQHGIYNIETRRLTPLRTFLADLGYPDAPLRAVSFLD